MKTQRRALQKGSGSKGETAGFFLLCEERFARGADRAVTNREQSLQQTGEAIDDLASGRVSLTTIKDEVTEQTKKLAETVTDRDKLKQFAKGKIAAWLQGIDDWSKKRSDDQLDDAGEWVGNTAIDGAVGLGMGAVGRGLGGAVEEAAELRKAAKAERKAAKVARREETAVPNPHGSHGAPIAEPAATGVLGSRRAPLSNATYQPLRHPDTIVGDRIYSGHALDQMQNRGLMPSLIEHTLKTGVRSADPIPGRLRFFDPVNKITVITEENRIVTVIPGKRSP